MGYRTKLGKVSKSEKARFEGKTYEEVENMLMEDEVLYYPSFHTQLYELGKYVDYPEHRMPFYSFDVCKECESEFDILSKEGLIAIIKDYHQKIYENYRECLDEIEGKIEKEDFEYGVESFIRSREMEWRVENRLLPYRLEEQSGDGQMTGSWQYEYSIFNLVYILRTFDWENDFLIYSAW